MPCPKCHGLLTFIEEEGLQYHKCQNCGKYLYDHAGDPGEVLMKQIAQNPECNEIGPEPDFIEQNRSDRIIQEALRKLENPKPPKPLPRVCSIPNCSRPPYKDSVQCEQHYTKALRNNIKHRERYREALKGTAVGAGWKTPVLEVLEEQRDIAKKRVDEIEKLIASVKGI